MPSPFFVNLRERVVAAVAGTAFFRRSAARFGVSVSSASRWSMRFAREGHVALKLKRGDRSPATEERADLILAACQTRPKIFLRELRDV